MPDNVTQSEYGDPHHNELSEGGVTVAAFQTEEECNFASYLLSEGVRSAAVLPERSLDLLLPEVRVAPDDGGIGPPGRIGAALPGFGGVQLGPPHR